MCVIELACYPRLCQPFWRQLFSKSSKNHKNWFIRIADQLSYCVCYFNFCGSTGSLLLFRFLQIFQFFGFVENQKQTHKKTSRWDLVVFLICLSCSAGSICLEKTFFERFWRFFWKVRLTVFFLIFSKSGSPHACNVEKEKRDAQAVYTPYAYARNRKKDKNTRHR